MLEDLLIFTRGGLVLWSLCQAAHGGGGGRGASHVVDALIRCCLLEERAAAAAGDGFNPDLVLFVGEALVGNDAVDHLAKFNQSLADLSSTARPIDGIVLTKFDTVDDKVGAALSMVYTSGAPVMFVGCGQSYTDLKKLDVKSIVKTLLM